MDLNKMEGGDTSVSTQISNPKSNLIPPLALFIEAIIVDVLIR